MRAAGFAAGTQWFNGSFVEDIESSRRARPPGDIDLVTFADRPHAVAGDAAWLGFLGQRQDLFNRDQTKLQYYCDAYFVDISRPPLYVVRLTSYWCGLFSHQRDTDLWKGIIEVPLVSDDAIAATLT
jgi:hypothetical protein